MCSFYYEMSLLLHSTTGPARGRQSNANCSGFVLENSNIDTVRQAERGLTRNDRSRVVNVFVRNEAFLDFEEEEE